MVRAALITMPIEDIAQQVRLDFVAKLVPSALVAMGGSQLVSYLQLAGTRRIESKQRAAFMESLVRTDDTYRSLSRERQDEFRRFAVRVATEVDFHHPTWASIAVARGTVTLSLWQTALEMAVFRAGEDVCRKEQGQDCPHGEMRFKEAWKHFIGCLTRLNATAAKRIQLKYSAAESVIQLRHRLVHGTANAADGASLEERTPDDLSTPMAGLRQAVIETTLTVVYGDHDPEATMHRAHFDAIGIPLGVLDEALAAQRRTLGGGSG